MKLVKIAAVVLSVLSIGIGAVEAKAVNMDVHRGRIRDYASSALRELDMPNFADGIHSSVAGNNFSHQSAIDSQKFSRKQCNTYRQAGISFIEGTEAYHEEFKSILRSRLVRAYNEKPDDLEYSYAVMMITSQQYFSTPFICPELFPSNRMRR
jgi:hypothetical protein